MRNDTTVAGRPTRRKRQKGERGIAMVMVGLLLIPMLVFAAFGVDLASWYARISALQRSADAAALAGAVWMPNISAATTAAENSLRSNHMHNDNDPFLTAVIGQGRTSTSLRVEVTDANADRFFSSVFMDGPQSLTRYAEAEYNLPLPLGSPLNYFGGDGSITAPEEVINWHVQWPSYYNTRAPQINGTCNISTSSSHELGQWTGTPPAYSASGYSGSTQCSWGVGRTDASGTSSTPPPDYTTRAPNNPTCRVRSSSATHGYWLTGPVRFATSGSSTTTNCVWNNSTTDMSPLAGHPLGNVAGGRPNATPVQRPCRVGYAQSDGWYTSSSTTWTNSGTPPTGMFTGGSVGQGNRLCTWSATVYFTDDTPPNPIPSDRDPGFWANIYGPGQYAANGDAFSTRCTNTPNCSTVQNVQYRPTTDPNRGEWYVVEVPPGVSGTLDINVFDASLNIGGFAPDITDGGSGTADFETEYRVFTWNSTLDFNNRGNAFTVGAGTNVHNDGSCWWELRSESDFDTAWSTMCTRPVSGGERFLVNVRTNAVTSANNSGNNGYAMEAVINDDRYASPGPSIYAYRDMVISNNNECPSGTCEGTFYLAKVDPIYAGRTLVLELFDAGDSTGASVSTVYPMMPSPTLPRPVVNVPASDCTFTATPAPNVYENSSNLRIYSGENRAATTATAPDSGDGHCGIRATISNTRQYNGMWLRIRVDIPTDYACDRTVNNPEVAANSCWWGIRYRFNGNASDTTTWQARVEGNPLQLTE